MKSSNTQPRTFPVLCIGALLVFFCLLSPSQQTHAVPADPNRTFEVVQPDGAKLILRVIGDENNGRLITEDGYTVIQDADGWYRYAVLDATGKLTASNLKANMSAKRSATERDFLAQIPLRLAATRSDRPDWSIINYAVEPNLVRRGAAATTNNVLLILIKYPDEPNTFPRSDFDSLVNGANFDLGSLSTYFSEISYDAFTVSGTAVGFYTASHNRDYYGYSNGWSRAVELAREAIIAARDAGVDFAPYDNDNNGYVDGLFIVHAGPGAEAGYHSYPWSHSGGLSSPVYASGKTISAYTMEPEMISAGVRATIGVYAHEYGHAIGLPDLYDTDYSSDGIGNWCLMSGGSWNGNGKSPAHMSAWCKIRMGWLTPTTLSCDHFGWSIAQAETNQACFKLRSAAMPSTEYFLVENRQKVGFDYYLPGCGIAIWHVDDTRNSNSDDNHRWVDLECADNNPPSQGSDLWINKTFNGSSTPNSHSYSGAATSVEVRVLSPACAPTMLATLKIGVIGDADIDGVIDSVDNCPAIDNSNQLDSDSDGLGNVCDNCPTAANRDQHDVDGDGIGDACDPDIDNDGFLNAFDNCKYLADPSQANSDADSLGDACDNCPLFSNNDQWDSNDDGVGDWCDGGVHIHPGPILADAYYNQNYSLKLQTAGGVPPFTWSYVGGDLPYGLDFAGDTVGTIYGKPSWKATFYFTVALRDGSTPAKVDTAALTLSVVDAPYICGDANGDKAIDISDAVYLITYIFSGGSAPSPSQAGDASCDGAVDISDAVYLIAHIFSGGPMPCAACK